MPRRPAVQTDLRAFLDAIGLQVGAAARLVDVPVGTMKSWIGGHREPPYGHAEVINNIRTALAMSLEGRTPKPLSKELEDALKAAIDDATRDAVQEVDVRLELNTNEIGEAIEEGLESGNGNPYSIAEDVAAAIYLDTEQLEDAVATYMSGSILTALEALLPEQKRELAAWLWSSADD